VAEIPTRGGTPTLLTTANTPQTILTAGASLTWTIIRDITIVNETSGVVIVTYGIGTSNADAAGKRLLKSFSLSPGALPFTWGGFLPLLGATSNPDLLYAECDTTNGATITVGAITGP
jgi:hypothetical protein